MELAVSRGTLLEHQLLLLERNRVPADDLAALVPRRVLDGAADLRGRCSGVFCNLHLFLKLRSRENFKKRIGIWQRVASGMATGTSGPTAGE